MTDHFKPLCLSFWVPPVVRPQAILIGKMIPEWIKQGTTPTIVSYAGDTAWDIAATKYSIDQWKINKYVARLPIVPKILKNKYSERIFRRLCAVVKKEKPDLIFSFANPQDSNIFGARLKKHFGIPFISHFSDPWADNPYSNWSNHKRAEIIKLERFIIEQSDRVVFTNIELRDLVLQKFPASWKNKTVVIPHCFDEKEYPARVKNNEPFIFSHIGALYGKRTPEFLFLALQELLKNSPKLRGTFCLKLVGAANSYAGYTEARIKEMAKKYGLADLTSIIPPVSYTESLRYMKQSDCLIVIDADIENSPFLPSKVVDYAGSKTAILGITPSNSPTDTFLKELGQKCFNYKEKNTLITYLRKLIQTKTGPAYNEKFRANYSVEATSAKLLQLFKDCTTL